MWYTLLTKPFLVLLVGGGRFLIDLVLKLNGRSVITWSDIHFLLLSPGGWLVMVLFVTILAIYLVFDLHVTLVYCQDLLAARRRHWWEVLWQAAQALPRLLNWRGLIVIIFIGLVTPLVGTNLSISLTRRLQLPNFIAAVIDTTPSYALAYYSLMAVLAVVGVVHIFLLPGVVLDGLSVRQAAVRSRALMKKYFRNYLWQKFLFFLLLIGYGCLVFVGLIGVILVASWLMRETPIALEVYSTLLAWLFASFGTYLAINWNILLTVHLYCTYRDGYAYEWDLLPKKASWWLLLLTLAGSFLLIPVCSPLVDLGERYFANLTDAVIVAHRAGGHASVENSLSGLRRSIELGFPAAEFDIQRTADGIYVVNHDVTFKRMAGVDKKVTDMTLAEIRQLCLRDARAIDGECEPVPTLDEFLDTADKKLILFIELKGETADEQMVDDVVTALRARGFDDTHYLLSIERSPIVYANTTYPDINSVYNGLATYGDLSGLPGQIIALEESAMTTSVIDKIHQLGKKAMVWTPNSEQSLRRWLVSAVDYVLTDEPDLARQLQEQIHTMTLLEKIQLMLNNSQ